MPAKITPSRPNTHPPSLPCFLSKDTRPLARGSSHDGRSFLATCYAYRVNAPAGIFRCQSPVNRSDRSKSGGLTNRLSSSDFTGFLQAYGCSFPRIVSAICRSNARKSSNRFSFSENLQNLSDSFQRYLHRHKPDTLIAL